MHKHHIIPKHEGGSDFAENIVELTVTQHAMWHFAEWQRKGNWRDRLAWRGLAGLITSEEATKEAQSLGSKGIPKPDSVREKIRKKQKENWSKDNIREKCKEAGRKASRSYWDNLTPEQRKVHSERARQGALRRWANKR